MIADRTQRGMFEGGVYHANALAEQQVIEEAMQPCSEKVGQSTLWPCSFLPNFCFQTPYCSDFPKIWT